MAVRWLMLGNDQIFVEPGSHLEWLRFRMDDDWSGWCANRRGDAANTE